MPDEVTCRVCDYLIRKVPGTRRWEHDLSDVVDMSEEDQLLVADHKARP